ncbi:MAG: hypothetical protein ABI947_24485 [Chloroflexota bacterium]
MNTDENLQTIVQILADYANAVEICPVITGQMFSTHIDDTLDMLQQALVPGQGSQEPLQAAQIRALLGRLHFEQANLYDARLQTEAAVLFMRRLNNEQQLAQWLGNLATIEFYDGNPDTALIYVFEAALIAEALGLSRLHGYLLCTLGAILCYLGQYEKAEANFAQAQQIFIQQEDELGIAWQQFTRAREYARDLGTHAQVIQQLELALPILREKSAHPVIIEGWLALADSYIGMRNMKRASELLQQVDDLSVKEKYYWCRAETYLVKAHLTAAENDYPQASKYIYKALGLVGDKGDLRILTVLYRTLASILARDRNHDDDTRNALDRAIATGRARARRLDIALALRQAGQYHKQMANRPTIRARSAGFLFEADRMLNEMGIDASQPQGIFQSIGAGL